ncbi:MAG: hypothetical protein KJ666_18145 [Bacteroidetes bacterium]|nr:hypothetical protein [Bacteroidota bacterium]MBU2583720.1 hypothetical protein [Bacteroidota bacterium]
MSHFVRNLEVKRKSLENYSILSEDIKPMKGEFEGYFRMRAGKLRIIFFPDKEKETIFVDAIGFRDSIY